MKGRAFCMEDADDAPVDCAVPDGVVQAPFVRRFIGDTFIAISSPDWFKQYRPDATP